MANAPLPNVNIPVLGPDGLFVLPWRRWFQSFTGDTSSSGLPGPPGPAGPAGPAGPSGTDDSEALAFLNLSTLDGSSNGVISVGLAAPPEFVVSGSPVTSSGTLTLTKATESANTVWAGPTTGSAAQPAFRSLVGADLPHPSATTLGGIESLAAVSHEWINQISTSGVPSATQPAASDLSDYVGRTTFTPTITFATPGDLSVSYATQAGAYAKVGPLVLFWYNFIFTPTYTTASGLFLASLPPVTPTDVAWAWPVKNFGSPTWPGAPDTMIVAVNTASGIAIQSLKSAAAPNNFTTTQIVSGVQYRLGFSGFFF